MIFIHKLQNVKKDLVKYILHEQYRLRHYWKSMDCTILQPPSAVRGMCELNRNAFQKQIHVPRLCIPEEQVNRVLPLIKKLLLKMEQLRPVRVALLGNENITSDTHAMKEILLHPLPVKDWHSLPITELEQFQVDKSNFSYTELQLGYQNWRADEIFKAVLPIEEDGLTSYSRIGHIVHLNLRDHLLPYKSLIGDVLCDKVSGCRTVVNKAATIDNTYRNFQLELVCGQPDYQVETKENGVAFEFDFSRVYWNPRLSTEHERIVQMLHPNDILYDVFAGVGPFSVPAARKRCYVLANDLNPESYRWLQHNVKRNRCTAFAQLFNKDGREFILQDIKDDLLKRWSTQHDLETCIGDIHITMNLPALAIEFLDAFRGLFQHEQLEQQHLPASPEKYPIVHVYTFAKQAENRKELAQTLVEQHLDMPLGDSLQELSFVRNVAPNKDMYRVSFRLTKEMLITPIEANDTSKRKRVANDSLQEDTVLPVKVKCN